MMRRWVKGLSIPVLLVLVIALAGCCLFGKKKEMPPPPEEVKAPPAVVESAPAPVVESELEALKKAAQAEGALLPIYFDFDKYNLQKEARANLDKTAAWLSKNATVTVQIEGNCDERGTAEYNLALGERRANAAKQYAEKLGIAGGRLSTISYGKEKPLDAGHDEAAWSKNRRDDFTPTGK